MARDIDLGPGMAAFPGLPGQQFRPFQQHLAGHAGVCGLHVPADFPGVGHGAGSLLWSIREPGSRVCMRTAHAAGGPSTLTAPRGGG